METNTEIPANTLWDGEYHGQLEKAAIMRFSQGGFQDPLEIQCPPGFGHLEIQSIFHQLTLKYLPVTGLTHCSTQVPFSRTSKKSVWSTLKKTKIFFLFLIFSQKTCVSQDYLHYRTL